VSIQTGVTPEKLQITVSWFQRVDDDSDGRRKRAFAERAPVKAWIASVDASERLHWGQMQHPVTHNVIIDRNIPTAQPGDYFLANGKRFYVVAVENPGELSIVVKFICNERPDRDD